MNSKLPNLLTQTIRWLQQNNRSSKTCEELVRASYLYSLSTFLGACLREGIFQTYTWKSVKNVPQAVKVKSAKALILSGRFGDVLFLTNTTSDPLYLRVVAFPELIKNHRRRSLASATALFKAMRSIEVEEHRLLKDAKTLFENSQAHLLIGFARKNAKSDRACEGSNYLKQEMACVYGHALYPFPKLRVGFGLRDSLLYSNEQHKGVGLRLVSVPNTYCRFSSQAYQENRFEFYRKKLGSEVDVGALERDGRDIIPVHPWQVRNVPFVRDLVKSKRISLLPGCLLGKPLVSLRTLHLPTCSLDVKLSLSTTITSEARSIYQFQSQNAPIISTLLARLIKQFEIDTLRVQKDVASNRYADFLHGPGLTAIFREPPVRSNSEKLFSAAFLFDGMIDSNGPAITKLVRSYESKWKKTYLDFFGQYARIVLKGPLTLLQLGIGTEPHMQNSMMVFKDSQPHALILRDTDSANLMSAKLSNFVSISDYAWYPETWQLMQSEGFSIDRFWHAAIRSHLGSLISTLAASYDEDEGRLWQELKWALEDTKEQVVAKFGDTPNSLTGRFFKKYEPVKCLLRMKLVHSERFIIRRKLNPLWRTSY